MYIGEYTVKTQHERLSKCGKLHSYYRNKTIVKFRCDNCDNDFERPRGNMDPKRLNNNYFHVCENCDSKRFGQKRGVTKKKVWNMSVNSNIPISKL